MTDISPSEFLVIIRWTVTGLANHVRGRGGRYCLAMRKKLQKALAEYTQRMHCPNPLDKIQLKGLAMAQKLEKWARLEYVETEVPRMAALHPFWQKKRVIRTVKGNWEILATKESY